MCELRKCKACQQELSVDEFYASNLTKCKKCIRAYLKNYRKNRKVVVKECLSTKICRKCSLELPPSDFFLKQDAKDGRHPYCKSCCRQGNAAYWQENKERLAEHNRQYGADNREAICKNKKEYYQANKRAARDWALKKRFGITLDEYEALLDKQGGCCAICGGGPGAKGKSYAVDHDHPTGKIRGILCSKCNRGLGYAGESLQIFGRIVEYLVKWAVAEVDCVGRTVEEAKALIERAKFRLATYSDKRIRRAALEVSVEVVDRMIADRNNRCDICLQEFPSGERPALDHDHKTGMIRGVLCKKCNWTIGAFKDSAEVIQKAIEYLKRANQSDVYIPVYSSITECNIST